MTFDKFFTFVTYIVFRKSRLSLASSLPSCLRLAWFSVAARLRSRVSRAQGRRSRGGGQGGGKCPPTLRLGGQRPPPPQIWPKRGSFDLLHSGIFAHLAAINVKNFSRLRRAVHTFTTVLAIKLNSLQLAKLLLARDIRWRKGLGLPALTLNEAVPMSLIDRERQFG